MMTDTTEKKQSEQTSKSDKQIDWFLQQLVELANSRTTTFGITLNVGGILISGTLIGGKRYFEGFARDFAKSLERSFGGATDEIRRHFEQYGDIYELPPNDSNASNPTFIHIENAKYFSPAGNPLPAQGGMFWRGKLSAVDGFILGALTSE